MAGETREEIHIENRRLMEQLDRDLKRYDIIYLQAQSGWGKYTFLQDYRAHVKDYQVYWLEEEKDEELCRSSRNTCRRGRLIIIPRLEEFRRRSINADIWKLLEERNTEDRFLFSSELPVPEDMLIHVASRSLITYGVRELRPSRGEVGEYFRKKGLPLDDETLLKIEKDLDNRPLCIYMLENPLRNSHRGYTRAVLEQCLEDTFSYLDVTRFRAFPLGVQEGLLELSCFEVLTPELLEYMLKITHPEAEQLLRYLLECGSVIEPCGKDCYRFSPLFGTFLNRIITKYLDLEEHLDLYRRAMTYFKEKKDELAALRFASLLKDEEQMADLLNRFLEHHASYTDFVLLEDYFLKISPAYIRQYPRLICAGAMLEAILDNLDAAEKYEQYLTDQMGEYEDGRYLKELQKCWIYLKICRPGPVDSDSFFLNMKKMREYWMEAGCSWIEDFMPNQVSILHGDKDYCELLATGRVLFQEKEEEPKKELEKLFGKRANGLIGYLLAELYYEYNQLDRSLNELSKSMSESRMGGNERLMHMCGVLLADLLTARNQAESADVFLLRQMDEEKEDGLYYENFLAHRVYYDLLRGDRERVDHWMKEHAPDESGRFYTFYYNRYLMKARVYIWEEKYMMARLILQSLKQFAGTYGMSYLGIQIRILEAIAFYREGNPSWKEPLSEALKQARRYNFIRVFADEGGAVYDLLREISPQDAGENDAYFRSMLSAVRAQMLLYPRYLKKKEGPSMQAFSSYEMDVLRLLALGEKNSEIAKTLCVSENTVKYHLKNIYQKLNVSNRSQAIKLVSEYHLI